MPPVLPFENVSKQYRAGFRRDPVRALDGFTLAVEAGEIFGFLGPNGSGKTTAIHIAMGFTSPTSGSGRMLGRSFGDAPTRRRVGFLGENVALYHRPVAKLVRFYGALNGIRDPELAIQTMNHARVWLAPILALAANSPFWQGQDSSYASFRYQAWGRWPGSGPTGPFRTAQSYHDTVRQMVQTGTLLDEGMVYFDARLSGHYQTIEIRVADVPLHADDTVLIAALARALVETEARAAREGKAASRMRTEVLRLAAWRASRSSLDDVLLSPVTGLPEPAADVVKALVDHCRDALADTGDADTVADLLTALLARGNGAVFQRAAYRQSGHLHDVVSGAVAVTRDNPRPD